MRRAVAIIFVVAAVIAGLQFVVLRRARTNQQLRLAAEASQIATARETPDYERPVKSRQALALLERALNGTPDDQHVSMLLASNYRALGRTIEAESLYLKALSWGERPEILVALSGAQARVGHTEAAIDSLIRALAFDPHSVVTADRPDLRAEAMRRFEARVTPRHRAEMYLNMAIAYLSLGLPEEAVEMAARGAMHDGRILSRPELTAWGDVSRVALRRYAQSRRTRMQSR